MIELFFLYSNYAVSVSLTSYSINRIYLLGVKLRDHLFSYETFTFQILYRKINHQKSTTSKSIYHHKNILQYIHYVYVSTGFIIIKSYDSQIFSPVHVTKKNYGSSNQFKRKVIFLKIFLSLKKNLNSK